MSTKRPADLAVSVRDQLLNLSRQSGENFELIILRYANERFLYRLSKSEYVDRFVLKGAMLFTLWTDASYRPTRDVDLLGYGDSSVESVAEMFQNICSVKVKADGLLFDPRSVTVTEIRGQDEYHGQRVKFNARLAGAEISMQVDVGFGDAVTPSPALIEYPTLLEFPAPKLRAYPRETFIAEKLQAMVDLGIANSRMKDFFDVWKISQEFPFDGRILVQAIKATFERRQTPMPVAAPIGLTVEFASDPGKAAQWNAFLSRSRITLVGTDFTKIISDLNAFIMPAVLAAAAGQDFKMKWPAGGPWAENQE